LNASDSAGSINTVPPLADVDEINPGTLCLYSDLTGMDQTAIARGDDIFLEKFLLRDLPKN